MHSDIIVIGAGPAGLSFCKSLEGSGLKITVLDKLPKSILENPPADGREIALTHASKQILKKLEAWDYLPTDKKHYLREAKVINGQSPYSLHFRTPKKALGETADTLGYLIANQDIRKSLYAVTKNNKNLLIRDEARVTRIFSNDEKATVELDNGEELTANLVIAADSRFSETRTQMGISAEIHDFGRTVIVFRMKHTLSNENTAVECFHYGRTLAILPLSEFTSSIVVTIDASKAKQILDLNEDELRADIIGSVNGRLGDMHLVGKLHSYPLVGVHANRFYNKRFALIGDAAVGMHPVTAHGFNLGLASQEIITKLIINAVEKGEDIASEKILRSYQNKHIKKTFVLYHGTNLIVKLFTTETPPAKLLRQASLFIGNNLLPFKSLVSKQLTD